MSRLYLSNPCAFFTTIAHGAAGAVGARPSLRPLFKRGTRNAKSPDEIAPRERIFVRPLWLPPRCYNTVIGQN